MVLRDIDPGARPARIAARRASDPLRRIGSYLPASFRRTVRRVARLLYRAVAAPRLLPSKRDPPLPASAHVDAPSIRAVHEADLTSLQLREIEKNAPFIRQTIDYLNNCQAQPDEVFLRRFQAEIIGRGFFEVPSPFTGLPISSGESIVLPDRTAFYRFPSEPRLLLAAANLGRGYPIVGIFLQNDGLLIKIDEPAWGVEGHHVDAALAFLRDKAWGAPRPVNDRIILTGDPNFAHHAWNQLGALETLARRCSDVRSSRLLTTFAPLGSLPELLPELSHWAIEPISANIPSSINAPGRAIVNLGGLRVTDSIRECVLRIARRHESESARSIRIALASRHPVIWISIRTRNRTAENQSDFIAALCGRIFASYPDAAIILDGHSSPADLDINPNYDRNNVDEAIAEDSREADRIIEIVHAAIRPQDGCCLLKAVGLTILDSILLAHHADFYICHHGTVQHKIGWMTDIRGVVHSNPRTLSIGPASWMALQAGQDHHPVYFPSELIGAVPDTADGSDMNTVSRLFENYIFLNIKCAAEFCMEQLRSMLAERTKA